jgi:ABC-type sugar transport system, periplasmic component
MKRRLLTIMMTAVLTSMSLAGCGNNTTNSQTGSIDQEKSTEQVSSNTGEKVTLELWNYLSSASLPEFEKVVEEFNASQDRIEVVSTFVARADLMNQYTMGAISGELPDIGMVDGPDMASYIEMGVFEDITDLINSWGQIENFISGPLESCRGEDGQLYGLPHVTNCLGLFYNKDLLSAAGYENPPATWEELKEIAAAVTDEDTYGMAICARGDEEGMFNYIPWLYSTGQDIQSLDTPEAAKSLEFLSGLIEDGAMSKEIINWNQSDVKEAFASQKTAMMVNGPWQVPSLLEADFEWGVALIPRDEINASVLGGENFGICAGTKYKEEAFEFLAYMMDAQKSADFCEKTGKFPPRTDALKLKQIWTEDPIYSVFAENLEYAVPRGPHAEWPKISEAVYTAFQAVYIGEKTPEEALSHAAEIIAVIYNK